MTIVFDNATYVTYYWTDEVLGMHKEIYFHLSADKLWHLLTYKQQLVATLLFTNHRTVVQASHGSSVTADLVHSSVR